jgi:hypothetical protein
VRDITATLVADPFMVVKDGRWFMFFEALNAETNRGEIGLATSRDGFHWNYEQIVLREQFHLSYPHVFQSEGQYYLVPESAQVYAVRLYKAVEFPTRWSLVGELLRGRYVDSSLIYHAGAWWLFTSERDILRLYSAPNPVGPWVEHPRSPLITGDPSKARPGGRVTHWDGKIIRYAQDSPFYLENRVRAFVVDRLTPSEYDEHEADPSPILEPSGSGWNGQGMHHLDPHQIGPDQWLACVDGLARHFVLRL